MNKEQIEKLKDMAYEVREDESNIYHIYGNEKNGTISHFVAESKKWDFDELSTWETTGMLKSTKPYTPKPEPVKMPLTYEDMKQRAIDRKPMWIVTLPEFLESFSIRHFDSTDVVINTEGGKHNYTYEQLMELNSTFIDGDPCYKLSEPGRSEK